MGFIKQILTAFNPAMVKSLTPSVIPGNSLFSQASQDVAGGSLCHVHTCSYIHTYIKGICIAPLRQERSALDRIQIMFDTLLECSKRVRFPD